MMFLVVPAARFVTFEPIIVLEHPVVIPIPVFVPSATLLLPVVSVPSEHLPIPTL
jgi:hypothetical protein